MAKKYPIIEVEWVDSMSHHGWESITSKKAGFDQADMLLQRSCGYLIARAKDYVAVAHSIGIGVDNACDAIQIPRCSIRSMRYLKEKPHAKE